MSLFVLPNEMISHITTFLSITDMFNLALCNSSLVPLFVEKLKKYKHPWIYIKEKYEKQYKLLENEGLFKEQGELEKALFLIFCLVESINVRHLSSKVIVEFNDFEEYPKFLELDSLSMYTLMKLFFDNNVCEVYSNLEDNQLEDFVEKDNEDDEEENKSPNFKINKDLLEFALSNCSYGSFDLEDLKEIAFKGKISQFHLLNKYNEETLKAMFIEELVALKDYVEKPFSKYEHLELLRLGFLTRETLNALEKEDLRMYLCFWNARTKEEIKEKQNKVVENILRSLPKDFFPELDLFKLLIRS
jgi:hypothetical protein